MLVFFIVVVLCGSWVAGSGKTTYTTDELAFINSVGGFGDVGTLDISHKVVPPDDTDGFSLKVVWQDHPGPPHWWSIRIGLPGSPEGFDRFSFDLYVQDADDRATLKVFLYEEDDDRWICWSGRLAELKPRRWHHIEVSRSQMRLWLLGNHKPQWERLAGLALEPGGGRAVFYVDNPRLTGPAGTMNIFTSADDGFKPRPDWHFKPAPIAAPGVCYFPFDSGRLTNEALLETPVKLARLLGRVGVPISGYSRNVADQVRYFTAHGLSAPHYSALAAGYIRFITRRHGWAVRFDGVTPNRVPFSKIRADCRHLLCHPHPAVIQALRLKIDALLRAGFSVFMVVDYVMPYWGGLWGYHPVFIEACRRALAARDEGLHFTAGDGEEIVHFPDYFRMYNGFFPSPSDLGLKSWDQFVPPDPRHIRGELDKRRLQLFMWLRTYMWLKLADQTGRYMRKRGGDGLWIVPNPEDTYGSPDYIALARCSGVSNIFPEWFGPIGWAAEAGYASLPYLRRQAELGHTRLSIIQETGAGGHALPYLDWRIAYAGVYALTAAGRLQDFDNDFIDHVPYDEMANPDRNLREFIRFRDAVAKAMAFQAARRDRATRPPAKVVCIASRPPVFRGGSFFFGLAGDYSLAVGLARARIQFDLRDSFDLKPADLAPYKVVVYSPRAPRVGDLQMLRRWVEGGDRLLVTHSFVPTRRADEWWRMDTSPRLGNGARGALLGLGRIEQTDVRRVTVTAVAPGWDEFKVGETIDLPEPLVRCAHGEPLVDTTAGPLVSLVRLGPGRLVYLHYPAGKNTAVRQLDARVMKCVARVAGIKPYARADFGLLLQVFDVPGGKVVIAWDGAEMAKWHWEYRPNITPMAYEAPGVSRKFAVFVVRPGRFLIYDFFGDKLTGHVARDGWIGMQLNGRLCGLWYLAEDSPAGRALITSAAARRRRMRKLRFDEVGMTP